jgi:hypothetical protein
LRNIFGGFAHIINPDVSLKNSPVDTLRVEGAINYIKRIEIMIEKDKGVLKKPIVAIWNTYHQTYKNK